MKLSVLVSGRGSNLRALHAAIAAGRCAASLDSVIADRDGAAALDFAREHNIRSSVVPAKAFADRADWDRALADELLARAPDLVVLAGFMRLVGKAVLASFAGRIVNVHPALLPSFPGIDGPAQALRHGVTLSGCTVHLVDDGIDTGPILAQAAVPVQPSDDVASLHARIQRAEHQLLPDVIHAIATGRLQLAATPRIVPPPPGPLDLFMWPKLSAG
jgi:phosphoribosylglycinamide formyltransferase-1